LAEVEAGLGAALDEIEGFIAILQEQLQPPNQQKNYLLAFSSTIQRG